MIGTDLVEINRFEKLKNDDNFMNKVFNEDEINYIKNRSYNLATIAGLYASKEAFLKAIKKGINNYSLKDIEIYHDDNNAPYIKLHNELKEFNSKNISLSISHDGDYVIAVLLIL